MASAFLEEPLDTDATRRGSYSSRQAVAQA